MELHDCLWCGAPLPYLVRLGGVPICHRCWWENGQKEPIPLGTPLTPEIIEAVRAMNPREQEASVHGE